MSMNGKNYELIDDNMVNLFAIISKQEPYMWLRRRKIYGHIDLDLILNECKDNKPVYVYTRISPYTERLHYGNLVPLLTTMWLHNVLNMIAIIHISDNDVFYKKDLEYEKVRDDSYENIKDVMGFGFDPKKTLIFLERDVTTNPSYMETVHDIMNVSTLSDISDIYHISDNSKLGDMMSKVLHIAPMFCESFDFLPDARCLVVGTEREDREIGYARELADRLGNKRPAFLVCKTIPPLPKGPLYFSDSDKIITEKILGYDCDEDLSSSIDSNLICEYIKFFEEDDSLLREIYEGCKKGLISAQEIKNMLIRKLTWIMKEVRALRDENIDSYMISGNMR